MKFLIDYDSQPLKFLKNQDKHIAQRIIDKIDETLAENPVPHNAKSIVGHHNCFRIRIGKNRIIYRVDYQLRKIVIFKLDKRPRAYDNLD